MHRFWLCGLAGLLLVVGVDCRREANRGAPPSVAGADRSAGPKSRDDGLVERTRVQPQMGTEFRIQVAAEDPATASRALDAAFEEVARVESLISSWESSSELSRVNRMAGEEPVEVGEELLGLVEEAKRISRRTDGAFDLTFAACESLWSFRDASIPSDDQIDRCREKIGFREIRLDSDDGTLFLPEPDMRIGVGGIGKGFGVDRAAVVLEQHGVVNYLVDGGGDVRVRADDRPAPWRVGVAHPRRRGELLGQMQIERGAVVTSGDYERYFERDGVRYHHILDPRTARPARKSVAVTVFAERAARADALSTGLFVLGPDRGIELTRDLDGVEAMVVAPDGSLHATDGFDQKFRQVREVEP